MSIMARKNTLYELSKILRIRSHLNLWAIWSV